MRRHRRRSRTSLVPIVTAAVAALAVVLAIATAALVSRRDAASDRPTTATEPGSDAATPLDGTPAPAASADPAEAGDAAVPPATVPPATVPTAVPDSAPQAPVLRGELVTQWQPVELFFEASQDFAWSDYPLVVTFEHPATAMELQVDAFWDGGRVWRVRFAPSVPGQWSWRSTSQDPVLDGQTGDLAVIAPTAEQLLQNANFEGHLRVSADGVRLERASGDPFFWLGDTAWWFNSTRCPLEASASTGGLSCADYFDDRVAKGFTVLGLEMFDIHNANEGGFPFPCNSGDGRGNGNYTCLNPDHFRQLDRRMELIWERGLVSYANVSWLVGQLPNDGTSPGWAMNLGRYVMARYGWLPQVFSLSGEYQYGYDEFGVEWTFSDWNNYGTVIARSNAHDHPLTVHPSSSFEWEFSHPGAGRQSSAGEFHDTAWLDVNSIQSGHDVDRLQHNPQRVTENAALLPRKPVLHAEGFYLENADRRTPPTDAQLRWQAYVPLLNGAFGHIYGAVGIWNMYAGGSAEDYPQLRDEAFVRVWWDVMAHPSSTQVGLSRAFYEDVVGEWWELVPRRGWLSTPGIDYVDGRTDPHLAAVGDGSELVAFFGEWLAADDEVVATDVSLAARSWSVTWFDPRTGVVADGGFVSADAAGALRLPNRPAGGDWALVLTEVRS